MKTLLGLCCLALVGCQYPGDAFYRPDPAAAATSAPGKSAEAAKAGEAPTPARCRTSAECGAKKRCDDGECVPFAEGDDKPTEGGAQPADTGDDAP